MTSFVLLTLDVYRDSVLTKPEAFTPSTGISAFYESRFLLINATIIYETESTMSVQLIFA